MYGEPRNAAIPKVFWVARVTIVARAQTNFSALLQGFVELQPTRAGSDFDTAVQPRFQPVGEIETGKGCAEQGCERENRAADEGRGAPLLRRTKGASAPDLARLAQADREVSGGGESQRYANER
jgi:hypothetical protein